MTLYELIVLINSYHYHGSSLIKRCIILCWLHDLLRPLHDLIQQIPGNISSLPFHNLLNPTLLGKFLKILPILKYINQLLRGNQIINNDYLPLILLDSILLHTTNLQQFLKMTNQLQGRLRYKCTFRTLPIAFQLATVSILVFLCYSEQLLEVRWLLVLLVIACVDVVAMAKSKQILDLVLDYAHVVRCDCVDLVFTVLEKTWFVRIDYFY